MRVIIWGINYAPEPTGISVYTTDLADYLQRRGMTVEVVTGFPYYPAWDKRAEDRGQFYRREQIGAIPVHRCWLYVPRRLTALRRILHEVSFAVSSLWRVLRLPRGDVYVVVSPPLGLGLVAWLATRLKRSAYLFHVQDLQPDSAAGLGMVRAGFLLNLMYVCERFAYRHAAAVSGISPGMTRAFGAKGVSARKIFLLPNWLRSPGDAADGKEPGGFRRAHDIPADALLAVYSGNLGRKQGLEVLLDAAENLAASASGNRSVRILIAGDGAGKQAIEERLRTRPLANLKLLPLLATADYQAMLRDADLALVPQMPGTGQVCFPSKLLSVLAAGLPVIAAADETSDLAEAVREGGFGLAVPAGDAAALADALRQAAARPELLGRWAARTRWVGRFSPELMLAKFEHAVRAVAAPESPADQALRPLPAPSENFDRS